MSAPPRAAPPADARLMSVHQAPKPACLLLRASQGMLCLCSLPSVWWGCLQTSSKARSARLQAVFGCL